MYQYVFSRQAKQCLCILILWYFGDTCCSKSHWMIFFWCFFSLISIETSKIHVWVKQILMLKSNLIKDVLKVNAQDRLYEACAKWEGSSEEGVLLLFIFIWQKHFWHLIYVNHDASIFSDYIRHLTWDGDASVRIGCQSCAAFCVFHNCKDWKLWKTKEWAVYQHGQVWWLVSSPEPKAHRWAYSIPMLWRPLSVHPSAFTISNIFFSETAWPIKGKFYVEPPWVGGTKVCSQHVGHMTKMATKPTYGKNPSKIFFSRTGGPISTKLGM